MNVRDVVSDDAADISDIYNHYIKTSHSTFELEPVSVAEMERRILDLINNRYPFFVAERDNGLVGYAFGHQYRPRAAYLHSIEISVYIRDGAEGSGVGTALYNVLIPAILHDDAFHAVIAGISLPNDASIRLHEKFGFEKIAHFREVGQKFDRWIDVGYWQLSLR